MKLAGLPVIDAEHGLKLEISYRDNYRWAERPMEVRRCQMPVAMPGIIEARVYRSKVYLLRRNAATNKKYWTRYQTSSALRSEIIAFDRGSKFDPGTYHIGPVAPTSQLGALFGFVRPGSDGRWVRLVPVFNRDGRAP